MSSPSLTTTEHAVLGLLGFGESSGYDLARGAERSIAYMWAPSRSQIYKVLPRLVAWGHATRREVEQRGRPDKDLYTITRAGRAVVRVWVENVETEPAGGDGVFLLKLFFSWAAPPEAGLRQLEAYRRGVEQRLAAFEAIEGGLPADEPVQSRIALRHGIARARATLEWAADAQLLLRDPVASRRSR